MAIVKVSGRPVELEAMIAGVLVESRIVSTADILFRYKPRNISLYCAPKTVLLFLLGRAKILAECHQQWKNGSATLRED